MYVLSVVMRMLWRFSDTVAVVSTRIIAWPSEFTSTKPFDIYFLAVRPGKIERIRTRTPVLSLTYSTTPVRVFNSAYKPIRHANHEPLVGSEVVQKVQPLKKSVPF